MTPSPPFVQKYLDCYGDSQELSFGDEGLDLLYKARRVEGSGETKREVLQSYFFVGAFALMLYIRLLQRDDQRGTRSEQTGRHPAEILLFAS